MSFPGCLLGGVCIVWPSYLNTADDHHSLINSVSFDAIYVQFCKCSLYHAHEPCLNSPLDNNYCNVGTSSANFGTW